MVTSKEYKELKKELVKMEKDISAIKKSTGGMCDRIDKLHNALVGDAKFGQDGLVSMVKTQRMWMEAQKYMYAKIYGGMIAISTITGVIIKFWSEIF